MGRRRKSRATSRPAIKQPKIVTWDRTIVCLPTCYPEYCKTSGGIAIPRKKRSVLSAHGLIGKIHLESHWSEEELFAEIRSVFADPMENDPTFPFRILLPTGSGTKSLTVPSLSSSFKWTPKEVAGRVDSSIYILSEKKLKNEVINSIVIVLSCYMLYLFSNDLKKVVTVMCMLTLSFSTSKFMYKSSK